MNRDPTESAEVDLIVTREVLTENWTDWIDYWAVDFNFESKREIVRVKNEETAAFGRGTARSTASRGPFDALRASGLVELGSPVRSVAWGQTAVGDSRKRGTGRGPDRPAGHRPFG